MKRCVKTNGIQKKEKLLVVFYCMKEEVLLLLHGSSACEHKRLRPKKSVREGLRTGTCRSGMSNREEMGKCMSEGHVEKLGCG